VFRLSRSFSAAACRAQLFKPAGMPNAEKIRAPIGRLRARGDDGGRAAVSRIR
jgi:hypothetical protein